MKGEKVLVLGASENSARYSNKALKLLIENGYSVHAVGRKAGEVDNVRIHDNPVPLEGVDTITLYLRAENQRDYYNYIESIRPRRVIFNPGAESPEYMERLQSMGIQVEEACTLVMLNMGVF